MISIILSIILCLTLGQTSFAEKFAECDTCDDSVLQEIKTVDLGNSTFSVNIEAHVNFFQRKGCQHALLTCKAGNMVWNGKAYFEINNIYRNPIPAKYETNAEFYCEDGDWRFNYHKDKPIVNNVKCVGFY